jgi:F-type H+-transporting ATPase subunit gamma
MANLKEIRNRISSTTSTQQITKAMKLVSATKLKRAQDAITRMRPYSEKLQGILANLSDSVDDDKLGKYFSDTEANNVLLVVVSSDRGLCGGFNANVVKKVKSLAIGKYADQAKSGNLNMLVLGKKSMDYLKTTDYNVDQKHIAIFQDLNSENAFSTAQHIVDSFIDGTYDKIEIVYNQFVNAATQNLVNENFLPIKMARMEAKASSTRSDTGANDYLFEPNKVDILEELIPRSLKTQLYKAMLDSFASEHGARMVAMDGATENAGELIKGLKVKYNKARQAAITNEISEIVGGAMALEA